jgi:hypothetical protein
MGACRAGLLGVPATRSRGAALSSAILYLAIVAIWAVVLVPRWLRLRSAPDRQTSAELFEDAADAEPTETESAGRAPIEWEDSPPPSYELFDTGADASGPAGPVADRPGEDEAAEPVATEERAPVAGGGAVAGDGTRPAAAPTPAERRARVLRARRRMLLTVVSLAVAAAVLAATRLAPVWVVIPPAFMLAGFLVLLREAAHSDALRAQHQMSARSGSSAVAGHQEQAPAVPTAPAATAEDEPGDAGTGGFGDARPGGSGEARTGGTGEATAQVIDISQRLGDQLYDQYTDAAERAVGD